MTVVEELVSVLGLEIGEGALATLTKFRAAVTQGLAGVGGIVAALGAAFVGTVVSVAELGTEINTTALKIGIGTDALQEMKYAADISNVSFETLTTAMKFLSKNAAEGSDSAKRIFEAFSGIPMRDAQGNLKKVDVLLEDFADKIAATKDPVKQVELAMHALHGQSGVSLLPMLKLGKKGIQALREEAEALGYVLDKKTIESSARFNVSLKHLKNALLGVRNSMGAPFIDDFSDALDWVTERVRASRAWFQGLTKDIRDLGQRFGRLIEVGKKAFEMVRKFITENKLDKLADTVHWVEMLEAALIGVAAIAVVSAASFAASWLLAAAPFIIIATLIGLIVDDIAHFLSGGDSVLGMADKWARAFKPEDNNLIKFLKQATQLLFDLGDPAKWRRVTDAARELTFGWISDVNGWGPRGSSTPRLAGAGDIPPPTDTDPQKRAQMEWDRFSRNMKHGETPSDFVTRPLPPPSFKGVPAIPPPSIDEAEWQAAHGKKPPDMTGLGEGQDMTLHLHLHGVQDPSDPRWIQAVQDFHDKANSDAKAAITGGS